MSSRALRRCAVDAARHARHTTPAVAAVRRFNTWEGKEQPLQTPDDWTKFQLDRASYKNLGAYPPIAISYTLTNYTFS